MLEPDCRVRNILFGVSRSIRVKTPIRFLPTVLSNRRLPSSAEIQIFEKCSGSLLFGRDIIMRPNGNLVGPRWGIIGSKWITVRTVTILLSSHYVGTWQQCVTK